MVVKVVTQVILGSLRSNDLMKDCSYLFEEQKVAAKHAHPVSSGPWAGNDVYMHTQHCAALGWSSAHLDFVVANICDLQGWAE